MIQKRLSIKTTHLTHTMFKFKHLFLSILSVSFNLHQDTEYNISIHNKKVKHETCLTQALHTGMLSEFALKATQLNTYNVFLRVLVSMETISNKIILNPHTQ